MFCSGCGLALPPEQGFCPQCGRPAASPVPSVPGLEFELQNYAGKIKALAVVWYIYAANAFLSGRFGPWMQGPWANGAMPPFGFMPAILHFAWVFLVLRAALALAAGWGLMERAPWGRIVAIVAAILSLIKFPFGTAIGIWTLVVLLGYRNSTLYEQLP